MEIINRGNFRKGTTLEFFTIVYTWLHLDRTFPKTLRTRESAFLDADGGAISNRQRIK